MGALRKLWGPSSGVPRAVVFFDDDGGFAQDPDFTYDHATGTLSAPTFTGSETSVVQPSIVGFMWKRTA